MFWYTFRPSELKIFLIVTEIQINHFHYSVANINTFHFVVKSHANFTVVHTYAQLILNFALCQKIKSHADVPKGNNNSDHPQMTQLRPYLHLNKPAYKTLFQQYNDPIYSYILIRTMHNEVLRRARNTRHQSQTI